VVPEQGLLILKTAASRHGLDARGPAHPSHIGGREPARRGQVYNIVRLRVDQSPRPDGRGPRQGG
jgi:hypothetical protein